MEDVQKGQAPYGVTKLSDADPHNRFGIRQLTIN
jgi:hypothetical protein